MERLDIIRAVEEWQRAGAYSVRIQGMNRHYHISLRDEFDEHDGDGTKYIVVLDDRYPIATWRFYAVSMKRVILGRVVVLPEYRGRKIGSMVTQEAEQWIRECGFSEVEIGSRIDAAGFSAGFYKKLGYNPVSNEIVKSGPFDCIKMYKLLI